MEAQAALEGPFALALRCSLGHRQQAAGSVVVIVVQLAIALIADDDEVVQMRKVNQFLHIRFGHDLTRWIARGADVDHLNGPATVHP